MRIKLIAFITALVFARQAEAYNPPIEEGKMIFMSRCASCHNINKNVIGPALSGIDQRRSVDWIINFVRSSQSLVKNGDKDAIALFEKFNKIPMPDHLDLTGEDVKTILEYISSESKTDEAKSAIARPVTQRKKYLPLSFPKHSWHFAGILVAIALLIAAILFAVKVSEMKRSAEAGG